MENKVLIYMQASELAPVGGQRGYTYNLKKELDRLDVNNIDFIYNKRKTINKYKNMIENMKKGKLRDILITLKSIIKYTKLIYGKRHNAMVNLNEYKVVHFHSTLDMYSARDSLRNYSGKVVLTSHSPTLLSKEIYTSRSKFEKIFLKNMYKKLIEMDRYAFERADYIVFPCEEAEEPYFHNWDEFSNIKKVKKENFRYVLTGIEKPVVRIDKEDFRKKYKIPQDARVISFVGRHNEIKGYDILKKLGQELLDQHKDVYFIIAGNEKPIKGLKHDRWIEIGWTKDPYSVINASDVFILPNRETYFDLVLLEVMALGKPVIASNTGGNKYFKNEDGIVLYSTFEDLKNDVIEFLNLDKSLKLQKGKANEILFNDRFNLRTFAESYINLYKELLREK